METAHMEHDPHTTRHRRGRGIGTVIACFAAAVVIGGILDDDEPHLRRSEARADAAFDNAAERENADTSHSDRATYRLNKGYLIIEPATGEMKIDMKDELRPHVHVKTEGQRVIINVADEYESDVKIKLAVPTAAACRIELAAGLLEVKRLPCRANDLIVRSGKMEVTGVPKSHGPLTGEVSVGSVTVTDSSGQQSKSAGVGELRAALPGVTDGPTVTARVNVGMLTVDVD
jgi:hypothetical protein